MEAGRVVSARVGNALILTIDNPPSNALTPAIRLALMQVVQKPDAAGIVICGAGAVFSSAISIEPDTSAPRLAALCRAVETCPVPVIAALNGPAIGAGAELAVAAAARVAGPGARLSFSDIAIGLPPEAGATQRLPRLIGPEAALRMLITGRVVGAEEGRVMGLFDAVAEDVVDAARAMLHDLPVRPSRLGDARAYRAVIAAARQEQRRGHFAIRRIIDCVEAALLLPMEAGLGFEAAARDDVEASDEVAGLRAAALAERRAFRLPPAVAAAGATAASRIGLSGLAPGVARLAEAALAGGLGVVWVAADGQALKAEATRVLAHPTAHDRSARKVSEQRDLTTGQDTGLLLDAPIIVHAGRPDWGVMAQSAPGTAHLQLDARPGEIGLGLPPSGRISELAVPAAVDADALAMAVATLRRIGLPPVLVGMRAGVGHRVAEAGNGALARLIGLGVEEEVILQALQSFGARLPDTPLPNGWGVRRHMTIDEVRLRWLGAMANEGLMLLEAGLAHRPSDIDHMLVAGHHFPRWRGGPMHQADLRGLMVLRRDLRDWAEDHPFWTPAPLIDRLIADGTRLSALNN